jgi:hypothetical protein
VQLLIAEATDPANLAQGGSLCPAHCPAFSVDLADRIRLCAGMDTTMVSQAMGTCAILVVDTETVCCKHARSCAVSLGSFHQFLSAFIRNLNGVVPKRGCIKIYFQLV